MGTLTKLNFGGTDYRFDAHRTQGIYYGEVDSTSTATVFTATVPGITELTDGTCMLLRNGVVTSKENFTININGLGAKPSYNNMTLGNPVTPTSPTRDTTIFNINYAMLFVYSSTIVSGGCWICYRGYDANTNTIGYQLRTNNSTLPAQAKFYRYRLLFTSADGTKWVPANTSTSTNATAKRDTNQTPIDPFGEIVWYGTTTAIDAGANVTAAQLWQEYYGSYTLLGYSFNRTGAALALTANKPIYIKCAPQANGSAIIEAETPYTQTLPSTEDGKIYIFLGRMVNATAFEIIMNHPIYWYKDGAIRLWTGDERVGPKVFTGTSSLDNSNVIFVLDNGVSLADVKDAYLEDPNVIIYDSSNGRTFNIVTYANSSLTATCMVGETCYTLTGLYSDLTFNYNSHTFASSTHTHGNITNAGDITTTSTIASGDRIVINDESASKITNSSITFGSSTTSFLANNGTWQTPAGGISDVTVDGTSIVSSGVAPLTSGSITPVTSNTVVTSASGATATYSSGVLTLTNGSFSTGASVTSGTAVSVLQYVSS